MNDDMTAELMREADAAEDKASAAYEAANRIDYLIEGADELGFEAAAMEYLCELRDRINEDAASFDDTYIGKSELIDRAMEEQAELVACMCAGLGCDACDGTGLIPAMDKRDEVAK